MNSKVWMQQSLTMATLFALILTFSMVTLANAGNAVGELTVIGSNAPGDVSSVTINGEVAKSGRTVFSSSTITTPEGMEAIVNFGKAGKIQFAPGTTFTIGYDGNSISGDLTKGGMTVLNAASNVTVKNAAGEIVNVKAGESANAASNNATRKAKPGPGGLDWGIWALIIGGAAAAVIIAVTVGKKDCVRTASTTC